MLEKATQGNAVAQNDLGMCYWNGDGFEKDQTGACSLFEKSAKQGNALGQYNLGICHRDGIGVQKDEKRARYYFEKSAEQGNTDVQEELKHLNPGPISTQTSRAAQTSTPVTTLSSGEVFFDETLYDLLARVEQGDVDAQNDLGNRYCNGEGVAQDSEPHIG